jgi:hypothetical protein
MDGGDGAGDGGAFVEATGFGCEFVGQLGQVTKEGHAL